MIPVLLFVRMYTCTSVYVMYVMYMYMYVYVYAYKYPHKADKGDRWCSLPSWRSGERFTFGSLLAQKGRHTFRIG